LEAKDWEVHTQLEDPTGSPLEDYPDGDDKEAELSRRLQELDDSLPKRALILKTSHIGGHKYAGNVIVRRFLLFVGDAVHRVLIDASRIDLHAPGRRRVVRPCHDSRGGVYRKYDYPWRKNTPPFTPRGCQPRAARL